MLRKIAFWIGGLTAIALALVGLREAMEKLVGPPKTAPPAQVQAAQDQTQPTASSQAPKTNTDELPLRASEGFIYLGQRDGDHWAKNRYSPVPVLDRSTVPHRGALVTLNGSVHLRKAVPPPDDHLAMSDDLGVLEPGTQLRVLTVTRLDPEGFYWAQVQVQSHE